MASVVDIFDQVAEKMRSDLAQSRSALQHPSLKGSSFEEVFRAFLREYLPKTLDVSSGVAVDSEGRSTRQLDMIVSDAAKTPIFYRSADTRVVPIEGVYSQRVARRLILVETAQHESVLEGPQTEGVRRR